MTMTVTGKSRLRISLDQFHSADSRQPQVRQDQRIRTLHQPLQRRRDVVSHADLAIGSIQQLGKLLPDKLAVIHHEDASIHGALIQLEVGGHDPGAPLRLSATASSTGCKESCSEVHSLNRDRLRRFRRVSSRIGVFTRNQPGHRSC